ncbi:MAG TPA: RdgB/HAM1 family non-canonical purine NTP pyrophosphatase [Anaerolineae bacterium]|nr:RdgB/HAM1 family non-canonical purine NTP pyrophosphatase [Anaerolineae bacterium]
MDLLIATSNKGKLIEIRDLLKELPIILYTPVSIGLNIFIEETGLTYEENVFLKAQKSMQASGLITLADDSGLEVEALDGQPGLISARYAPWENASDAERRQYLLEHLRGIPQPWKAQFVCKVALIAPNAPTIITEGVCSGEIIPQERGKTGFGYDPIFYLPSQSKTMAELSLMDKNNLSHRAKAVRRMIPHLEKIFKINTATMK